MSKLDQPKINLEMLDNILNQIQSEPEPKYKLVREHDGLTKYSPDITWLEWDVDGTFKARHNKPAIGLALLMSPFNIYFAWQTTEIIEILENQENFVKFKTKNSTYVLETLK
jgi:hypothetical protein